MRQGRLLSARAGSVISRQAEPRASRTLVLLLTIMGISLWLPVHSPAAPQGPTGSYATLEDPPAKLTDAETRIPGQYIVVLKDSVKHPSSVARAQTDNHKGEVQLVYRHALKGYSAKLSRGAVEALRDNPQVKYITPDRKVEAFGQTIPTGVKRVFAPGNNTLYMNEENDKAVNADVAVIDTGIDNAEQPELNVVEHVNCIPVDYGFEAQECIDDGATDGHGHGTHVAGTIGASDDGKGAAGVAPGVRLWAVKVLSNGGAGTESWIVAGVDWVTAHASQIEVANLSLGCGPLYKYLGGEGKEAEYELVSCEQPALEEAISASVDAGVVYAVAAGNAGVDAKYVSPANGPDVITVSAVADYDGKAGGTAKAWDIACNETKFAEEENYGQDDTLAAFSNYGEDVDVAAPGVCITSTLKNGALGHLSGTSMATPHVAGAAAILASASNPNSRKDVESIRQKIVENGNYGWTDTSEDGVTEPLLDVSDTSIFNASVVEAPPPPELVEPWSVQSTTAPTEALPYRPSLVDVSCLSASSCVALGGLFNGSEDANPAFAQHWNGKEWSLQTPLAKPVGSSVLNVKAVSCTSATACTAVGHYGVAEGEEGGGTAGGVHPVAWRWNGTSWQIEKMPTLPEAEKLLPESLTFMKDISCTSATSCIAVGWSRWATSTGSHLLAEHWNGEKWSLMELPALPEPEGTTYSTASLESISCVSASDCMATGEHILAVEYKFQPTEPVILHWDGKEWTGESTGLSEPVTHVSCSASDSCVALDNGSRAAHWDGKEWTYHWMPREAADISCVSAAACVAVAGNGERPLIERWNGTKWTRELAQAPKAGAEILETYSYLKAVSCPKSLSGCVAVGQATQYNALSNQAITLTEMRNPLSATATTEAATSVKGTEATLNASVNPEGSATTYQFEYGTTTSYGTKIPTTAKEVGSGTSNVAVSQTPTGLSSGTVYHYRVVATSEAGTTYGADKTLTTGKLPKATTEAATSVGGAEATLNATVNPEGLSTTYQFEYGTTTSYGTKIPTSAASVGSGTSNVAVSQTPTGLSSGTVYHYRVVATNGEGTTYGADKTLTTGYLQLLTENGKTLLKGSEVIGTGQGLYFQSAFGTYSCGEVTFHGEITKNTGKVSRIESGEGGLTAENCGLINYEQHSVPVTITKGSLTLRFEGPYTEPTAYSDMAFQLDDWQQSCYYISPSMQAFPGGSTNTFNLKGTLSGCSGYFAYGINETYTLTGPTGTPIKIG